jgi:hypothetical protein
MAFSKDVLAVLGMCCVDKKFRGEFFSNPSGKAEYLVGRLREDEVGQLERLAGKTILPPGQTRQDYVNRLDEAFERVSLSCDCPRPPCPDGF